jgi:phosphoribosylformylglycinamidine synthase
MGFLWGACPIEPLDVEKPKRQLSPLNIPQPRTEKDWGNSMRRVLAHYHCCDQSAAGSRFDTTVQGKTSVGPYGGRNHLMPTNIAVSAPLYGKPYGVITSVAMNPFYGEIDPAQMARLMIIEAITKAVVAGADYREMALCDNFYTPKVRPDVAWDLRQMVDAIAALSIEIGVPFISGKDSSSGTFVAGDRQIDVPLTLAVASISRVPDVTKIVTKELKQAGNKLVLVGCSKSTELGGSVYADSSGQRGERLYDPGEKASIVRLWKSVQRLHAAGKYVSASAIAEGGLALRLFEASFGSGLGARVELSGNPKGPRDAQVFGEFIGAALLEVPANANFNKLFGDLQYRILGEVIPEARLVFTEKGKVVWQDSTASLALEWSKTFREVVE